jgi:cytosine/adenosine deaminase-related metal-dependent hydrolase
MNLQRVVLNQMILNQGLPPDPVDWDPGRLPDVPNNPADAAKRPTGPLTTRDVLRFGTIINAKALRPTTRSARSKGKEADIIILDATRINVALLNHVPGAVVSLMDRTRSRP